MAELPMPPGPPTRARFVVLAFLCALSFVLYLDRVCISQAVEPIQRDLGLSNTQMGFVLMAFTLAYGLFEVPTGHWGDRLGARAILTRIAIWWSAFTALTAACMGFGSLLVVRFLFGAGEAGALPNTARVISVWFPLSERGRIQGLVQTTMLLGGASAPVVAAYLIQGVGWRWTFVLFGAVGLVWAAVFWLWFHDDPAQHPAVNNAERDLIGTSRPDRPVHHPGIPWAAVLSNVSIWTLGAIMTCGAFNSYFYLSWFPKYLQAGRGVEPVEAGWLASIVLGAGALGMFSGGILADAITRAAGDPTPRRRWLGASAYVWAAGVLWMGLMFDSPRALAGCAALSCLATTCTLSTWWSCASEVSGRHIGALFGLMNSMGVVGAMGSQFFFGAFTDWRASLGHTGREQWDPAYRTCVGVLLLAALLWAQYTSRPVRSEDSSEKRG